MFLVPVDDWMVTFCIQGNVLNSCSLVHYPGPQVVYCCDCPIWVSSEITLYSTWLLSFIVLSLLKFVLGHLSRSHSCFFCHIPQLVWLRAKPRRDQVRDHQAPARKEAGVDVQRAPLPGWFLTLGCHTVGTYRKPCWQYQPWQYQFPHWKHSCWVFTEIQRFYLWWQNPNETLLRKMSLFTSFTEKFSPFGVTTSTQQVFLINKKEKGYTG